MRLSLPTGESATLAAYDASGRRAATRVVGGASGWQFASLGRLPAGVYVVRLTQGRRSVSTCVVVIP